ncbi:MAG: hypothetical protein KF832_16700, partial [Caldilineaceae bacterium]|nr:hypothetical protein [Caldilineaceae bacterium]
MPNLRELPPHERRALDKIRDLLEARAETNWAMPEEYAIKVAQEIAQLPPVDALQAAKRYIEELRKQNAAVQTRVTAATQRRQELAE